MHYKLKFLIFLIIVFFCNAKQKCSEEKLGNYIVILKELNVPDEIHKNIILDYLYECRNEHFVKELTQNNIQTLFYELFDSSETIEQICTFERLTTLLVKISKYTLPKSLKRKIYIYYWKICPKYFCSNVFKEKIIKLIHKSSISKRKQQKIIKSFLNKCK